MTFDTLVDDPTDAVRGRVLGAIIRNRTGGFHLSGHLLAPVHDEITPQGCTISLESGPLVEAGDTVDPFVLCFLADLACEAAARSIVGYGVSLATVGLNLRFMGASLRGPLRARGVSHGTTAGAVRPLPVVALTIVGAEGDACLGSATFMALDRPAGVPPATPPSLGPTASGETIGDLDAGESAMLERAGSSLLAAAAKGGAFIRHFWGIEAESTHDGAEGRLNTGLHVANRFGVVHGGILVAYAHAVASAALSRDWTIASLDVLFVGPGRGPRLDGTATVVHRGRTTASVRVAVRGEGGRSVIEGSALYVLRGAP